MTRLETTRQRGSGKDPGDLSLGKDSMGNSRRRTLASLDEEGDEQPKPPPTGWRRVVAAVVPPSGAVVIRPELLVLAAVAYGVLYFSMGDIWLPGHPAFCTIVIWAGALFAAEIARWLRLPRVVGMLGAGLLLGNTGLVSAFPRKWGVQMRAAALATIFLRCGLELEFKTMYLYKWPALRLAFVPGVIEALFDAGIAVAVFQMPFTLAIAMGFILKAVGPGLVVPAMFSLQKEGWGAAKGVPSTVVIAASFDDIIAITGFSIFINIAIAGGENAAWQIASGPLQVIFGMVGGVIAGVIMGCTRVWDNKYKRLIGIYGAALLLMFFLEAYDMLSGGALGSLFVGLVTCFMWERGLPRWVSAGPSADYAPDIERVVAKVWNWAMEPLLFGTIGTSILFAKLQQRTLPMSILIVLTGVTVRLLCTFLVMFDRKYSWRDRLFYAVAWTPKATVQASLSAVPLGMIQTIMADHPDQEKWQIWGEEILTTGVLAIIFCGTLGTLGVFALAPVLLEKGEACIVHSRSESRLAPAKSPSGGHAAPPRISIEAPPLSRAQTVASQHGALLSVDDLHGLKDHSLIEEYFDTIERLMGIIRGAEGGSADGGGLDVGAANGGGGGPKEGAAEGAAKAHALELCDAIENLQERIDREVGPRQMTVRQMLHHTAIRSRQASKASRAAAAAAAAAAAVAAAAAASEDPHHEAAVAQVEAVTALARATMNDRQSGSWSGGGGGSGSGGSGDGTGPAEAGAGAGGGAAT